jgi:hypothetical protein
MSIPSRLRKFETSLQYRELALLWLKTAQARTHYSEYWKISEFQPWASENEEAGLMYQLAFEVNGAVITAAQRWRVLMSWASLLGIFMLATTPQPMPFELGTAGGFLELSREKLCTISRWITSSKSGSCCLGVKFWWRAERSLQLVTRY